MDLAFSRQLAIMRLVRVWCSRNAMGFSLHVLPKRAATLDGNEALYSLVERSALIDKK